MLCRMAMIGERHTQVERTATMKARLLEATFECLAEVGYAGTTTTEVARRAGVSRGAQLHHFPTKADLVIAAHEHVLARRRGEFLEAFAALPPEEQTQSGGLGLLWRLYQGPAFAAWLELAVAARTDPGLHRRFLDAERKYWESVVTATMAIFPEVADHRSAVMIEFGYALLDGLALQKAVGVGSDHDEIVTMLQALSGMFMPPAGAQS
jgi:AcrR family transcriptional regulator